MQQEPTIGLLLLGLVAVTGAKGMVFRDLQLNYSALVRPVRNYSESLKVAMKVFLQQIVGLDEKNQVIELNAWLKFIWIDYRLSWNPVKYDNIGSIRYGGGDNTIWQPDILLYNSADETFDSTFKSNLVVYSTGEVNWVPPGIFRASCKIDITWFPFDDQICFLKFGSWTYNGFALDLQIDTEADEDAPVIREETMFQCCPEPYPTIKFLMYLRRRTLFYGFNLIIPSLLISMMTLLGFCLPAHDMSEKIGYQTTILLSVCFFLTIVSEMIPATSEAVPILGVFFSTLTLIVSVSTAFTITVLNLRYRQPANRHMSATFRSVFLIWLPWLLLMKRPGYILLKKKAIKTKKEPLLADDCLQCIGLENFDSTPINGNNNGNQHLMNNCIMQLARDHTGPDGSLPKAPPLYRRLYSIPTERLGLERKVGEGIFMLQRSNSVKFRRTAQYEKYVRKCMEVISDPNSQEYDEHSLAVVKYYKKIQERLHFISKRMARKRELFNYVEEYKFAAMALDRLCLIIFMMFLTVSITAIFLCPPYINA